MYVPSDPTLILLVEDNLTTQKLELLQLKILGYQVEAVCDGREAVNAVALKHYDLILMDCQMPEVDGFEATMQIRQRERSRGTHTPIIALTVNDTQADREKCFAVGMDDFLSKTGRLDELQAVLNRWIQRRSEPTQDVSSRSA